MSGGNYAMILRIKGRQEHLALSTPPICRTKSNTCPRSGSLRAACNPRQESRGTMTPHFDELGGIARSKLLVAQREYPWLTGLELLDIVMNFFVAIRGTVK